MAKHAIHAQITLNHNENIDSALKRFNMKVVASGIIQEVRDRQEYLKPSKLKRRDLLRNRMKKNE